MSDWQDKSDFEINKAVSEFKGFNLCEGQHYKPSVSHWNVFCEKFNPCNNPSDAWPIIQSVGISLVFMGDYWEAHALINEDEAHNTQNEKPLRAAMIVYLAMNGVKPNE